MFRNELLAVEHSPFCHVLFFFPSALSMVIKICVVTNPSFIFVSFSTLQLSARLQESSGSLSKLSNSTKHLDVAL